MISKVFPLARTILTASPLSYEEHRDTFSIETLPRSQYDRFFHLELGVVSRVITDQRSLEIEVPFTVELLFRLFNDTTSEYDEVLQKVDAVIDEFVLLQNNTDSDNIQVIKFNSMATEPIGDSNDNALIARIEFSAIINKCLG